MGYFWDVLSYWVRLAGAGRIIWQWAWPARAPREKPPAAVAAVAAAGCIPEANRTADAIGRRRRRLRSAFRP